VVDPFHVPVLHGSFSGAQFTEMMASPPQVQFDTTSRGLKVTSPRTLPDGRVFRRITEAVVPTLRVVLNPRVAEFARVDSIGFVLPLDHTSFRIYTAARVRETGALQKFRSRLGGKLWEELTSAEHQKFPGDYEAQIGQGPITLHSEEHLATSDKGIGMLRRLLKRQVDASPRDAIPPASPLAHPGKQCGGLSNGLRLIDCRYGIVREVSHHAPNFSASSGKLATTMSCRGSGSGSGGPSAPHSSGRRTNAVR
jgi:hypothetical protein